MNRITRAALSLATSALLFATTQFGGAPSFAQPRTPCDQLLDRLGEIQMQQAQVRADYAAALDVGDQAALSALADRLGALLIDTDQLLQRIDDCSRSPVPSQAD